MLKIGACLPTMWPHYGTRRVGEAIPEAARAADALGYASVWAPDHVIVSPAYADLGHIVEPLTTLASLVHVVPDLDLGTSTLVLPQRNAILTAKQAAALDVLSGGRFILGVGVGWIEDEFQLLQADFEHRGAIADEAIEAMQALWRQPEATFHGRFYDFSGALCYPKPTAGAVPLWVCGNTRAAIRRAARFGVAWNPFEIDLDAFTAGVAYLHSLAGGTSPLTIAMHVRMCIGTVGRSNAYLAGSVEDITASLRQYQRAGLAYLICEFVSDDMDDLLRQMRVMAEQIAPQVSAP